MDRKSCEYHESQTTTGDQFFHMENVHSPTWNHVFLLGGNVSDFVHYDTIMLCLIKSLYIYYAPSFLSVYLNSMHVYTESTLANVGTFPSPTWK